jgi:hypothetical protein
VTVVFEAWVTCPNCEQQYDHDEVDAVFELDYCRHKVCYMCSLDHRDECREFWINRMYHYKQLEDLKSKRNG